MSQACKLLKQYFGHSGFRPGQEEIVKALLAHRDVLGVMPTGAGKSVCYQLPALMLPGLTLVISPLISLMKDQVMALRQLGIPAAFLNSSLSFQDAQNVLRCARSGNYKILYVAPERLGTDGFRLLAQETAISLVAVDEAHCVSQWGQDFRPSYLKISDFIGALPQRPAIGAFTATATETVRKDIRRLLLLQDPFCITTGYDRPNLFFQVVHVPAKEKLEYLRSFLSQRPGQSGIVYCATQKAVDAVCAGLQEGGIPAARYHAGMDDADRRASQEDFIYDRVPVMVATNAFGMGIDKSNVRFVVHYNMPKDMESYYQEAGRAGRDGEPAHCLLLFTAGDVRTVDFIIRNGSENDALSPEEREGVQKRGIQRLKRMENYCRTNRCLRNDLLRYFGETVSKPCGNCGNCQAPVRDITLEAQKILSGVARVERKFFSSLGVSAIEKMLVGSKSKDIISRGLHELPTYGIMKNMKRSQLHFLIDVLIEQGYLLMTEGDYPVLRLTPDAKRVLFQGERVCCALRDVPEQKPLSEEEETILESIVRQDLFSTLKALRLRLAKEQGIPAYTVFSDATLRRVSSAKPHTLTEFLRVSGVSRATANRYGDVFLQEIIRWQSEHIL